MQYTYTVITDVQDHCELYHDTCTSTDTYKSQNLVCLYAIRRGQFMA